MANQSENGAIVPVIFGALFTLLWGAFTIAIVIGVAAMGAP